MVVFVLQIAVQGAVLHGEGEILVGIGPGVRQLTAGVHRAAEDVRQGVAALGAKLAHVDDGVDAADAVQAGQVHAGAAVDDQNELLIGFGTGADGLHFPVGQQIVALFQLPVAALARLPGEDVDAGVRVGAQVFIGDGGTIWGAEIVEEHLHDVLQVQKIQPPALFDLIGRLGFGVEGFKIRQPLLRGDGEATIFQALQHGDGVPLVDLAGAGAALDGHGRAGAVECHGLGGQGQGTVIFQQHHTLAGRPVGHQTIFPLPLGHGIGAARLGSQFHKDPSFHFICLESIYHISGHKGRKMRIFPAVCQRRLATVRTNP